MPNRVSWREEMFILACGLRTYSITGQGVWWGGGTAAEAAVWCCWFTAQQSKKERKRDAGTQLAFSSTCLRIQSQFLAHQMRVRPPSSVTPAGIANCHLVAKDNSPPTRRSVSHSSWGQIPRPQKKPFQTLLIFIIFTFLIDFFFIFFKVY